MKVLIGIQARTESKRFKGKIYEDLAGKSLLQHIYYSALSASREMLRLLQIEAEVYVLGPKEDSQLLDYCTQHLLKLLQPECEESDLISRYRLALEETHSTHGLRLTADCPFWEPSMALDVVSYLSKRADYASNTITRTFFEGSDTQGFSLEALRWFDKHQKNKREHPFVEFDRNEIIRESFVLDGFKFKDIICPQLHYLIQGLSIDTPEDLRKARLFYEERRKQIERMEGEANKHPSAGPVLTAV